MGMSANEELFFIIYNVHQVLEWPHQGVSIVTGVADWTEELWFDSCKGQLTFLFYKSSRTALWLTQPLIPGVQRG